MDTKNRVLLSIIVLIFLVAVLYLFTGWFSKITGYSIGEDQRVQLAMCLADKSAVLFITNSCLACQQQLEIFGLEAVSHLSIVNCNSFNDCPSVQGLPSWIIGDVKLSGVQDLDYLKKISGCN